MVTVRLKDASLNPDAVRLSRTLENPDRWDIRFSPVGQTAAARKEYSSLVPGDAVTVRFTPNEEDWYSLTVVEPGPREDGSEGFTATRLPIVLATGGVPSLRQEAVSDLLDGMKKWLRVTETVGKRLAPTIVHSLRLPSATIEADGGESAIEYLAWLVSRVAGELGVRLEIGIDPKGRYLLLDPAKDSPAVDWWTDPSARSVERRGGLRGLAFRRTRVEREQRVLRWGAGLRWKEWGETFPRTVPGSGGARWLVRSWDATWERGVRVGGDGTCVAFSQVAGSDERQREGATSGWTAVGSVVEQVAATKEPGGPFFKVQLLVPDAGGTLVPLPGANTVICGLSTAHGGSDGKNCGLFLPPLANAKVLVGTPSAFVRPLILDELRRETVARKIAGIYLDPAASGNPFALYASELDLQTKKLKLKGKSEFRTS